MSYRTLERIYVRMLFDPAFAARVYENAEAALAGLDLDEGERAQLVAVDRRAWAHDPLRRYRTLRILAEEFKASTTIALAATRSIASLDAFFSAPEFHAAVQERGSMAGAFVRYLERLVAERPIESPQLPDVLRLEAMLARCRRDLEARELVSEPPESIGPETRVGLAPGHAVGRFNANVVEAVNVAERYLFEVGLMPAVALCEDAPRLEELPPVVPEPVYLLALPSSSGVSLMPVDEDYYQLLSRFEGGPQRIADAADCGLPREEVETMLGSLLEEGVLAIDSRG